MVQNVLWVYGMGMAWMSVRFPGLKFCPSPPLSATPLLLQTSKYQDLLLPVHPQTCWCEQEILLWYKHTLYHPIIDIYRWNRGSVSEALQLLQQALANGEQQAHWLLMRKEPNQLHHVNNYVYIRLCQKLLACAIQSFMNFVFLEYHVLEAWK